MLRKPRESTAEPNLVEALESRLCLAGVTIITHGQQLPGDPSNPPWMPAMADAIDMRLGSPATRVEVAVQPIGAIGTPLTAWSRVVGPLPADTQHGHIIVLLNWFYAAQGGTSLIDWASDYSTVEVADVAMPELLRSSMITGMSRGLPELPIHLIGHSRGGSLVAELARRFAADGIWVDQITTLDPHPRGVISGDADAGVAWPVSFSDNYYQEEHWWPRPNGVSLGNQAADRRLGWLEGGYEASPFDIYQAPNHSDVRLWYHGTIDALGDTWDGNEVLLDSDRDGWYAPSERRGVQAGYGYSRVGGLSLNISVNVGDAPRFGVHADLGGFAERELTDVSAASWPNAISAAPSGYDDNVLSPGDNSQLTIRYWDADSPATLEAYLDSDTNPLNGFASPRLVQITGPATPGRVTGDVTAAIDVLALRSGEFYLVLVAFDASGHRRVLTTRSTITVEGTAQEWPPPGEPAVSGLRVAAAYDVVDASKISVRVRDLDENALVGFERGVGGWVRHRAFAPVPLPPMSGDPVHWRGSDGSSSSAYVSEGDLYVVTDVGELDLLRYLSSELAIGVDLVPELDLLYAHDGVTRIVARTTTGDVVLVESSGSKPWTYTNITADHLRANARAVPAFTGPLVTYATPWGGLNIAGLTPDGTLWSIWTSPEAGGWFSADLSATAGTPRLSGGLAPYITPWGGINIAGVEPSGALTVTWWAPGLGGEWRKADFSALYGSVDLAVETVVSYVTPWNALNVAGVDRDGQLWVYWWEPSRAGKPELDRWTLSRIDPRPAVGPSAPTAAGPITALSATTGRIDLFSSDANGEPIRVWWDAVVGDFWSSESLAV